MLSRSTGKEIDISFFQDRFIRDVFSYLEHISQKKTEPFNLKKINEKILKAMIIDFFGVLTDKNLTMEYNDFIRRATYSEEDDEHKVRFQTHNEIIKGVCIPKLQTLDNALTHIHEFSHYYIFTHTPKAYRFIHYQEYMSIYNEMFASYLYDYQHGLDSRYGLEAYRESLRESWDFALVSDLDPSDYDKNRKCIIEGDFDPDNTPSDEENPPTIEDMIYVLKDYGYKISHLCAYKMLQLYKGDPQNILKMMRSVFVGGNYIEDILYYYGVSVHNYNTVEPTIERIRRRRHD